VSLEDLVGEPEGPAVQVVAEHHVIAGVAQVQDGVGRRQSAGEGEGVLAAFQRRQATLQGVPGGVPRAGVLEALVFSRPLLRIRRGEVDRCHDRAGGRVGPLPGVDGERLEMIAVAGGHGAQ
jgi:hypothetical protein